eukprot:4682178-Prymnesium_polylepis.1
MATRRQVRARANPPDLVPSDPLRSLWSHETHGTTQRVARNNKARNIKAHHRFRQTRPAAYGRTKRPEPQKE